jgi:MFS superfamily sulfate permease-like transporter
MTSKANGAGDPIGKGIVGMFTLCFYAVFWAIVLAIPMAVLYGLVRFVKWAWAD